MNLFILTCLLCFVVCSTHSSQGSDDSADGAGDGGDPVSPAPSDGLQSSLDDDDNLDIDVEPSGGQAGHGTVHGSPDTDVHPKGGKKKKGKGKKKSRSMRRSTTPLNPEHALLTSGYTSTLITTEDPCISTHEHYCVHGNCKSIDGLLEPVCTCWKDYDGERCEIHSLGSKTEESGSTKLAQTVLVIIAVVLSVISCLAILLMTCAHYRSHRNFLASYLGTATEQEKLQKHAGDVVV
ncbi:proheparin-binding EGF-like growth factor [Takifugu flavidus]|uniref:EGF-like domain-containing protein n=1 Tax=Takifugu flavidus TaxID=433684 RepID=A0A5C6MY83_9TELE|nr:proheparin-binding EGF-like growth factor [Takifugu flavidus]TWW60314.1 hypothetical protein D4764_05G0004040 [Takifugu flavidus]